MSDTAEPATREDVLAAIQDERIRALIQDLERPECYDWSRLFPRTSGWFAVADVRRRVRSLRSIEPLYDFLLYPDERIEFVTRGILNNFLEQYFMGVWALIVNRTLFVFTSMRLILISCDQKDRARPLLWQIPYHAITKYGGWLGNVSIKVDGGKALSIGGVPGGDRALLASIMTEKLELARQAGATFPTHAGRDPLCASCGTPARRSDTGCAECAEPFISPVAPTVMSLLLPGLGHIYLGHLGVGLVEMLGFLIAVIVGVVIIAAEGLTGLAIAAAIVLGLCGVNAALTWHHATRGKLLRAHAWKIG